MIEELSGGALELRGGGGGAAAQPAAAAEPYELGCLAGARLRERSPAAAAGGAADADARLAARALAQLPAALGLAPRRTAADAAASFTALALGREARALRRGGAVDFAVTLVEAPSRAARAAAPGASDTREAGEALAAVVNIPLQAPEAVAGAVLALLAAAPPAPAGGGAFARHFGDSAAAGTADDAPRPSVVAEAAGR